PELNRSCGDLGGFGRGVEVSVGVEVFGAGVGGAGHAFEDVFGQQRDLGEGDAGGVLDGVEDCRSGAVHGKFADAFGAAGAVDAGCLLEIDADGREVGGGGHDVVGHLAVAHEAVSVYAFFVESVADALGDAALNLAPGEDGVDDLADLLQGVEVGDLGRVGESINGDLGDVDGPGIGGVGVVPVE